MSVALSPGTTAARVDFRFSVLGEMQLHRALAGRIRAVSDFRPVWAQVYDDYIDMEQAAFAQEGAYEGNPGWTSLNPKYAAWKARHFPGARILYLFGRLFRALTGGGTDQGATHIHRSDAFALTMGGAVRVGNWDLGGLHQTGTRRGMPARKPLLLSRARKSRWVRFLVAHLRGEGRE